MGLYRIEGREDSNLVTLFDTNSFVVSEVSEQQYIALSTEYDIEDLRDSSMEYIKHNGNIAVLVVVESDAVRYTLTLVIGVLGRGAMYTSEVRTPYLPSVELYGNELMVQYYDKHFYREDRGERLLRVWYINPNTGVIDKGIYGDNFLPDEY